MEMVIYVPAKVRGRSAFSLGNGPGQGSLVVTAAEGITVRAYRRSDDKIITLTVGTPVDLSTIYREEIQLLTPTGNRGLFAVSFEVTINGKKQNFTVGALVTAIMLDCDANRDGEVGVNEEGKANWVWGEDGRGAIVLVDNDNDADPAKTLDEREPIIVRSLEIPALPKGFELRLSTAPEAALWTCNGFVPVTYLIMPP